MSFPWYDSNWLNLYWKTHDVLARQAPARLAVFEQAFAQVQQASDFNTTHLPDFLDSKTHQAMIDFIAELRPSNLEQHEFFQFGRMLIHDHPFFNEIQKRYVGYISDIAGEEVEVGYNFLCLYNNLGICEPHMDAPTSKWTLDICIDQSDVWPIFVSDVQPWPKPREGYPDDWQRMVKSENAGRFERYDMNPKDALVFAGSNQWHYRDRISRQAPDNFCHLIFFHFITKDSDPLLNPANWAAMFDAPELSVLEEAYAAFNSD